MPRIRCRYEDCVYLESGYCTADRIELDPETGCLTYQPVEEAEVVPAGPWVEEVEEEEEVELLDEDEEEEELEWEEEDEEDEDADEEW